MRPIKRIQQYCLVLETSVCCLVFASSAQSALVNKSPTGTDLTAGSSWGGTAPGSSDVATWISGSLGAGLTLPSDASWGGISVSGAASDIAITGAGTLTLGASGIDMSTSPVNLSLTNSVELGTNQTWSINAEKTLSCAGIISGSSGVTLSGNGVTVFTNANSYTGTTTVKGGTLRLDFNPGDTPTGTFNGGSTVTVNNGGTLLFDVEDAIGYNGGAPAQININGGLVTSADVANSTPVQWGGSSFRVTLPTLNFTGGALSSGLNNQGDQYGGSYLVSTANTYSNSITAVIDPYSISLINGVFNVAAGTTPSGVDLIVSSIIMDWGNTSFTKAGAGVMELDPQNSGSYYNQPVSVNGGTLVLNGPLGDGAVTVAGNASLFASGGIDGQTIILSGGTFGVGYTNINTLQLGNTLTFNSGSTNYMKISKNGGTLVSDQVQSLTSVTYGGSLVVKNVTSDGTSLASGDVVQLFTSAAYAGEFANYILPALPAGLGWDVTQLAVNGSVQVSSAVAPPAFNPVPGNYGFGITVTISSLTSGSTIYYTTDGTVPSGSSLHGLSPVTVVVPVNTNLTINAFSSLSGRPNSSVETAAYATVPVSTWLNPAGGNWSQTANWSNNFVANGVGVTADFSELNLGGADATVALDITPTVGSMVFGDQGNANNWILADGGVGPLKLDAGTNEPVIAVRNQETIVNAFLAGNSGFTKTGSGGLVLSAVDDFAGAVIVDGGTLQLNVGGNQDSCALAGNGPIVINTNGTILVLADDGLGYWNYNTDNGITINEGGTLTVAPTVGMTITRGLHSTGGTIASQGAGRPDLGLSIFFSQYATAAGFANFYFTSAADGTPSTLSATNIELDNSVAFTVIRGGGPVDWLVSGNIQNPWFGVGTVTLNGNGVTVFNNVNGYTGTTTVNGGTLALQGNGSIASSPTLAIASGAIFDVSGLGTPFVLGASQTLNVTSAAMLSGSGSTGTGTVILNYSNGIPSLTVSNGTLTLEAGTVIQVNNLGGQLPLGNYTLIAKSASGAVAGTVTNETVAVSGGGAAAAARLALADGQLNLVVGGPVNTNPINLMTELTGNTLNLSWPADHLGWTLQSNSIGLAASNQWFPYPDSALLTNVSFTIDYSKSNVFYRLTYP